MRKETLSVQIDGQEMERLRNAAWWEREHLVDIVTRAVIKELDRMEKANGESYPSRGGAIRSSGRPRRD